MVARYRKEATGTLGMAAAVHGSPTVTGDLDICYARDQGNLRALAAALQELQARLRGAEPGLPFLLDGLTLKNGLNFTFITTAGDLDCRGHPAGTDGFQDLIEDAMTLELEHGLEAKFCSLDALRRMKRAAGRPKDLIELEFDRFIVRAPPNQCSHTDCMNPPARR